MTSIEAGLAMLPSLEEQVAEWGASLSEGIGVGPGSRPTMEDFSRTLAAADVMDNRTIAAPGAVVVPGWGHALLARFRARTADAFETSGYEPYEFPDVTPTSLYEPLIDAFPEHQHLLYVADKSGLAEARSRAVLSPTGEAAVYTHFARTLRTGADLPRRLFRSAKYCRPGSRKTGRGLFRPLEAMDVYEFHAAVDGSAIAEEMTRGLDVLRRAIAAYHVPVAWTLRPPWTNHGALYRRAYGADTLLPTGDTVQLATIYDQGSIFSELFDVRVSDHDGGRHTHHVAGCVTRRLLLAHLFHSLVDGTLAIHPDAIPTPVVVRSVSDTLARDVADVLTNGGISARAVPVAQRGRLARVESEWHRRGVPVQVLAQPPRGAGDRTRLVVSDHVGTETTLHLEDGGSELVALCRRSVETASVTHRGRAARMWDGYRLVTGDAVSDVVSGGGVAVVGLSVDRRSVDFVERSTSGEVLGFAPAAKAVRCVVTDDLVGSYALVGGRG